MTLKKDSLARHVRRELPSARIDSLWTGVRARVRRHRRRRALGRAAAGTALVAAVAVGAIGMWRAYFSKSPRRHAENASGSSSYASRRSGLPRWTPSFEGSPDPGVRALGPSPAERDRSAGLPPAPTLGEENERRPSGFLTRQGRQLRLDGKPFRFVGITAYTVSGCGGPEEIPTVEEIDALFASLRAPAVIRTIAFEHYPLTRVEYMVEAATRYGHKLILVLTDHDGYCGEKAKTPSWYAEGYRESYLPWVRKVVGRFADSPAVGMWELVKAPVLPNDAPVLRAFFDDVGSEIHKIASRQLTVSGSHGPWAYGGETGFRLVHASAGIDVASFHDYNNTWAEAASLPSALQALEGVDKPLVVASVAFFGSKAGDPRKTYTGRPCLSWAVREQGMNVKLDATFRLPVAGAVIWNWKPRTKTQVCSLDIVPEDPVMELARAYRPAPYP